MFCFATMPIHSSARIIDPRHEKACLRCVRPNPKRWIGLKKESDLGIKGLYYLFSENKSADQLTCAFVLAYAKQVFS